MSIKKHELYLFYLAYVESLRMNKSQKKLMSISKNSFDKFIMKWEKDSFFKHKWEDIFKSWIRDKKLKKFLNENDTEEFEFNGRTEAEWYS